MSGILDNIRTRFSDAVVTRCSEKGCVLRLDDLGNYVALKGEQLRKDLMRMCDYIIFIMERCIIIGVVELKSGKPDTDVVVQQLNNGKEIALDILDKCADYNTKPEFYLLVLSGGWNPSQFKMLQRKKIEIRGKGYEIITRRCGAKFSDVLRENRKT